MGDAEGQALGLGAVEDLQHAAGVAGGDDGRAGALDVLQLAVEQFTRLLGLRDVVDARTAAAPGALGQLGDLQAGDPAQHFARLCGDLLAVA